MRDDLGKRGTPAYWHARNILVLAVMRKHFMASTLPTPDLRREAREAYDSAMHDIEVFDIAYGGPPTEFNNLPGVSS